jgi:hypothetical protein
MVLNCTVYGIQKFPWIYIISSLTPLSNAFGHISGEGNCVKKMFEKFISSYISTTKSAHFSEP